MASQDVTLYRNPACFPPFCPWHWGPKDNKNREEHAIAGGGAVTSACLPAYKQCTPPDNEGLGQ